MLSIRKVSQNSGNQSVYDADDKFTDALDIKRYGTLKATKFKDGWRDCTSDKTWPLTAPADVAVYDTLPITH